VVGPGVCIINNLLNREDHERVFNFLRQPGWVFGWKSDPKNDQYSFWHKHFAGNFYPDHYARGGQERSYSCSEELQRNALLLFEIWDFIQKTILAGHRLVRCYANCIPYGSEGSVHTDSTSNQGFTSIFYPHNKWNPNWGGETIFFNSERSDIVAAVYPMPNRLVIFNGTIPHVARGVSRICPVQRITLMFKSEAKND
jgi:SM-20-related protein